jgi:hypothetical protein
VATVRSIYRGDCSNGGSPTRPMRLRSLKRAASLLLAAASQARCLPSSTRCGGHGKVNW